MKDKVKNPEKEEHKCGCGGHHQEGSEKENCKHNEGCGCKHKEKEFENDNCKCGDGCGCHNNDVSEDALGYLEMAQRIQADFENYKKRNADIAGKSYNMGVYDFVEKLLPVFDSFKQARQTVTDEQALSGLNLIHGQLIKALDSFGIKKIECVGQEFDPNLHNAVLTDNNPDFGNDIITEELQEGFKSDTKVIRHSVVKINKI